MKRDSFSRTNPSDTQCQGEHAASRLFRPAMALLALLAIVSPIRSSHAQPHAGTLVVHEWGTFTQLQDEAGAAVGGINTDDEPVPQFVHRLSDWLLLTRTEVPQKFFKGAPGCHPDVTMRLETPVLYFHPSAERPRIEHVEVAASFRGGWLSEFYPDAKARAPGFLGPDRPEVGRLLPDTIGALAWNGLTVGDDASGPATTEHVWIAPRAVRAAAVRTATGETERFLFYRGVAHIDAPIAVRRDTAGGELVLESQLGPEFTSVAPLEVDALWLVDVRADGTVAYRSIPPVRVSPERRVLARTWARFTPAEYRGGNLERLQSAVHQALVVAGLYGDEADALLSTWELSYFKSPGQRIFFLVPRAWTDQYLPLHISGPVAAEVTRVMVGRIELVTPEQRAVLARIASIPRAAIRREAQRMRDAYYGRVPNDATQFRAVNDGDEGLAAYGVDVPESYQEYLSLGRFRNALVLDEARRRPSPSLDEMISQFGLSGYSPPEATAKAVEGGAP